MNKNNLKIDWCTHHAAKFACENWHYSGSLPIAKLVKIGVWENDKFIGVVIFSRGANASLGKPFGFSQTECCELTRVAFRSHTVEMSHIMKVAFVFLKKISSIKLVVSFADPEQGHVGGIYQAGNWTYAGITKPSNEYLYLGRQWHGKAFRHTHGSHIPFLQKGLKIVICPGKYRYLFALDKKVKKLVAKFALPYPKKAVEAGDGDTNLTAAGQNRPDRSI